MTRSNDMNGVTPLPLSAQEAERLVSGIGVEQTDDLAKMNAVLGALRAPADAGELVGLDNAVAAFGAGRAPMHVTNVSPLTRPSIHRVLTGRTLFTIGVITLASAGAAAAAGVVPTLFSAPRPHAATSTEVTEITEERPVVTEVGDTVPVSTESSEPETSVVPETVAPQPAPPATPVPEIPTPSLEPVTTAAEATPDAAAIGPDVDGPAKFGLCTAFAASGHEDDDEQSIPFQALTDAAAAIGTTVEDFCADAVPGGDDVSDSTDDSDGSADDADDASHQAKDDEDERSDDKHADDKHGEDTSDEHHKKSHSGDRS
jgi:hypothetical protein